MGIDPNRMTKNGMMMQRQFKKSSSVPLPEHYSEAGKRGMTFHTFVH